MKKFLFFLIVLCIFISGCIEPKRDMKLQREIFMECLATVPPGPQKTVTNDWDEVIRECYIASSHMSRIVDSE